MGQLTRFFAAIMFLPLLAACEDEQVSGPTADEITTAVIERFLENAQSPPMSVAMLKT